MTDPYSIFRFFLGCLLEMLSSVLCNYLNFRKRTASFRSLKINQNQRTVSHLISKIVTNHWFSERIPGGRGGGGRGGGFMGLGFF
jgi:hypothetical protein